jgi:hypothetical protein
VRCSDGRSPTHNRPDDTFRYVTSVRMIRCVLGWYRRTMFGYVESTSTISNDSPDFVRHRRAAISRRRFSVPRRWSQVDPARRGIVLAWAAFTVTFGGARLVT